MVYDNRASTDMIKSLSRSLHRMFPLTIAFAALMGAAADAHLSVEDGATDIHACVNATNGNLRIVNATAICKPHEVPLQWPATSAEDPGGTILVHGIGAGGFFPSIPEPICVFIAGPACEYRSPRDGTIQNMKLSIASNSYSGPAVVAIYVNGVSTLLTTTIPAGSNADMDVGGSVAIAAGDRVAVRMDRTGVSSGQISLNVSYEIR